MDKKQIQLSIWRKVPILIGTLTGLTGCSKGGVLALKGGTRLPNPISAEAARAIEESKANVQADSLKLFPGAKSDPIPVSLWRLPLTDITEVYEWLFGAGALFSKSLVGDENSLSIDRLRTNLSKSINNNWYQKYLDVAQTTADLSSSKAKLKSMFVCPAAETNAQCFARLKDKILVQLFMGTLTAEQDAKYKAIFDKVAVSATERVNAIHAVVKAALRSPMFLFVRDWGGNQAPET